MNATNTKVSISSYKYKKDVAYILDLKYDTNIDFQPGQYIEIIDGEKKIPMSIFSNCGQSKTLEIHVGDTENNRRLLTNVFSNKSLFIDGPKGSCTLKQNGNTYFIAFGMGITQINSLLEDALKKTDSEVNLIWLVKEKRDLYIDSKYKNLIKTNSKFKYHPFVSNERDGTSGKSEIKRLISNHPECFYKSSIYISGGKKTVQSTVSELLIAGVSKSNIHYDKY